MTPKTASSALVEYRRERLLARELLDQISETCSVGKTPENPTSRQIGGMRFIRRTLQSTLEKIMKGLEQ